MARQPTFDSLYVFAAAARHLSFTKAAIELRRTQSAVSHRMKALESDIGVRLFDRTPRGLELTPAGETLAHKVNEAITEITRTIAGLARTGHEHKLRVTTLPSVASRWLMPRLSRFVAQHPDIQVQILADPRLLDLRSEGIDLAIRFGLGRYRGHVATPLMGDRVLPVCSPRLIAGSDPIASVDALLKLPLLHDSSTDGDGSLSDWHSWLDQIGRADLPCHAGQRFSHAGLLIEAAALGLGVALARLSLVTDHLAAGTLVYPLPLTTQTAFEYYLVALPDLASLPHIAIFSEWLRSEAAATTALADSIHAEETRLKPALRARASG